MSVTLNDIARHERGVRVHINLSVAAVFSSWVLLQTMFGLYDARHYWQEADDPTDTTFAGGLQFANR